MTNWDKLRNESNKNSQRIINDAVDMQNGLNRVILETEIASVIAKNTAIIIDDIDRQFEKVTKLDDTDITFLFFATALQCIRQYVIGTLTQRAGHEDAAKKTKGHSEEHSDRKHRLYNPSVNEIATNPVPFDAIYGGKKFNLGIGGGFTHRAKTIGHDPLLGWIFGTMNIATSTVTVSEGFKSYHVLTGYTANGAARDKISKHADTIKVLSYSKDKLLNGGVEGRTKIGLALMKEAIHLKSDIYSKAGLPIPIISTISVDEARKLADYGLDMGNVLKVSSQAGFAVLINSLIGMIHGLFYDESKYSSWNLYSVKTRKILSYSNVIASASNVIAVAIAKTDGNKSLNYLDIGGMMVTIYRLVNDRKFIMEVKKEFLEHGWYDVVMN